MKHVASILAGLLLICNVNLYAQADQALVGDAFTLGKYRPDDMAVIHTKAGKSDIGHAAYSGYGAGTFILTKGENDAVNTSADTGVVQMTKTDKGWMTLLVPLPDQLRYEGILEGEICVDIRPALGDAFGFWGLVVTQGKDQNFWNQPGNMHVGILRKDGKTIIEARQKDANQVSQPISLVDGQWVHLRIKCSEQGMEIFVNQEKPLRFIPANQAKFQTLTHIGLEAAQEKGIGQFDNWRVTLPGPEVSSQ